MDLMDLFDFSHILKEINTYDKLQQSQVIFWSDEPEYNDGNRGGGCEPGNGDDS